MWKSAIIAALLSCHSVVFAFQSPPLLIQKRCQHKTHTHHRTNHRTTSSSTHLSAKKPAKRSKSKSSGDGFGNSGGFGSKKSSTPGSGPADPTKVRSVSGYTGSGTKVLASAANNFDRIRQLSGKDATTDVYVRSPLNDESTFWFVGKVIRMIEKDDDDKNNNELAGTEYPTEEEAILSQKRLILEYAKNQLRPQNMGGPYSKKLELWLAPG